jgi:hypothetical protein
MIFMQILKTNSDSIPCYKDSGSQNQSITEANPMLLQDSDPSTDSTSDFAEGQNATQHHNSHCKRLAGPDRSPELEDKGEAGYINEMVLNARAGKELGDVQVLWKWRTVCGRPVRQLELVTG